MKCKFYILVLTYLVFSVAVYILSLYSYPVFHTLIEFITVFIGISIFMISLTAIKIKQSNFITILAPGILVSTLIIFLHALTYEGMGLFPEYDTNLPTQLWIIANLIQSSAFLLSALLIGKQLSFKFNTLVFSVIGITFTLFAFFGLFPDCFVVGSGLTNFKIFSEYFIMILYVSTIVLIFRKIDLPGDQAYINIIIMSVLFIMSGFMFTQYASVFGIENFLGHIIRVFGLALLYNSLVFKNITTPLNTLFKKLSDDYQNTLLLSAEKTNLILNSTSEGIYGVDKFGNCTFVNESGLTILGFKDSSDVLGKDIHSLIHYKTNDGVPHLKEDCSIIKSINKKVKTHFQAEVIWKKDGTSIQIEYSANPQIVDGNVIGAVISFKDVSERIKYQESLIKASFYDSLTNLHNRRYYDKEIHKLFKQGNYPLTIVVGDIDGLKFVNDSFGHHAGDEYLKKVAEIMDSVCESSDLIARMGGDEFVLVLPNTNEAKAENTISAINSLAKQENIYSLPISVSFGYKTVYNSHLNSINVYKEAEDAMYQEKLLIKTSMRSNAIEAMMNALNEKDNYSEKHSRVVSNLCERIAEACGMTRQEIKEVKAAGLVHDIGKIIIPTKILNKVGKLTVDEYNEIKKHPEHGFRILSTSRGMKNISVILLSHHERWDGLGYPRGINGIEIPIQSRIIAIADAFDAMTSARGYRRVVSKSEALNEIKECSGTQFDPTLVNIFTRDFTRITVTD